MTTQIAKPETIALEFADHSLLPSLYGDHDRNLARLEQRLKVSLACFGNRIEISGPPEATRAAHEALSALYGRLDSARRKGRPAATLDLPTVDAAISWVAKGGGASEDNGVDLNTLVIFGLFGIPIVSTVLKALLGKTLGTLATGGLGGAVVWLVTGSLLLGLAGVVLTMMLGAAFSNGRAPRGGWGGGGWGGGGGGWSGGGGGGGGWSSGGGGSFGGGGASGRW